MTDFRTRFSRLSGQPNFQVLREEGLFYVDKTPFIAAIENEGPLLFCRPPRFGKSLFVNMLAAYYDINLRGEKFNQLFAGLAVGATPTPLASSFHVLQFDFSLDVSGDVACEFRKNVNESIADFAHYYNLDIAIDETSCFVTLRRAANAVSAAGGRLYVMVDEYDRFANKLLLERREQYDAVVRGTSGVAASSPIRAFFETLKALMKVLSVRIFVTGIMPLALHDASGVNFLTNVSHHDAFAALAGFRTADLANALSMIPHLDNNTTPRVLDLMRRLFNGYLFRGGDETLFNPTLVVSCLKQLAMSGRANELLQMSNEAVLRALHDDNLKLSQSLVAFLRTLRGDVDSALISLFGASLSPVVGAGLKSSFSLRELEAESTASTLASTTTTLPSTSAQGVSANVQSLLFYNGVATFAANTDWMSLRVPNEMVRESLYAPLANAVGLSNVQQFLTAPTADVLQSLLVEVGQADAAIENEATFQCRVATVLARFCRANDVKLEVITADRIRLDIVVVRDEFAVILELKFISRENVTFDANEPVLMDDERAQPIQSLRDVDDDDLMLLFTNARTGSHLAPEANSTLVRKVGHIVSAAQRQAHEQEQKLRQSGKFNISADSVVYAFVAVLVGDAIIVRAANDLVAPSDEKRDRQPKRSRIEE
jgi:hypothetical protein